MTLTHDLVRRHGRVHNPFGADAAMRALPGITKE